MSEEGSTLIKVNSIERPLTPQVPTEKSVDLKANGPRVWKESEKFDSRSRQSWNQVPAHIARANQTREPRNPATLVSTPHVQYRERVKAGFLTRMAIQAGEKLIPFRLSEVFWIQSKGNLLSIHLQNVEYDCRITMKELISRLDPSCFLRVHRNVIVNLDHVLEFDFPHCGDAFAVLRDGKALPVSRTGKVALRRNLLVSSHGNSVNFPFEDGSES
jgi:hypothetical protein